MHRSDIQSAVTQVLHTVDEANSIFRSTDFDGDGDPDNIGFYIKYLVVLQSDKTPLNVLPPFSWRPLDGNFDLLNNLGFLTIILDYLLDHYHCLFGYQLSADILLPSSGYNEKLFVKNIKIQI